MCNSPTANEDGMISQKHLVTITHTSHLSGAAPSLSFELLLAIWQRHPPHRNTHPILTPRAAAPKTRVGGRASTTTTVFGLLEPQQGLGSQWSTEAMQSSRPRMASTEHDMGRGPFSYAIGSDQRTKPKNSKAKTLGPQLHRSWRKKASYPHTKRLMLKWQAKVKSTVTKEERRARKRMSKLQEKGWEK